MFNSVIIGCEEDFTRSQARLASIIEFVADETWHATIYLCKDWNDIAAAGLETEGFRPEIPRIMCASSENPPHWIPIEGDSTWRMIVPTNELVLSNHPAVRRGILEQQGLNATTAILVLASCGIDIVLPNISFAELRREEAKRIREALAEEREAYVSAVTAMAKDALGLLSSPDLEDTIRWARNEAMFTIAPKARHLQARLKCLDRRWLERAGVDFWTEGVPAIGSAISERGLAAGGATAAVELVRTLCATLGRSIASRRVPEANYILKLARLVDEAA